MVHLLLPSPDIILAAYWLLCAIDLAQCATKELMLKKCMKGLLTLVCVLLWLVPSASHAPNVPAALKPSEPSLASTPSLGTQETLERQTWAWLGMPLSGQGPTGACPVPSVPLASLGMLCHGAADCCNLPGQQWPLVSLVCGPKEQYPSPPACSLVNNQ